MKVVATPLVKMEPGEYNITVIIEDEDSGLSATAEFAAIVTANYQLDLSTKTGRLSTEITSGKDNKYMLMLGNNGSASIENISLTTTEPEGWMVEFDNKDIETLKAGGQEEI
ncbi:MAG: NEW3 domain-containing protein [Actinomycetota bacterium]|nr:NEW3 domain-containing protein [Actinomycetota bacterium]